MGMLKFIWREGLKFRSSLKNKSELVERVTTTAKWCLLHPKQAYFVLEDHVVSLEIKKLTKNLSGSLSIDLEIN